MVIRAFLTHKLAESYKDCQDSFDILVHNKAVAIADGISQSIFPKIWADLLTRHFVRNPSVLFLNEDFIDPIRNEWYERVAEVRLEKEQQNDPYLWKLDENLASGRSAGATFLGLKFEGNKWSCLVLGDSCLIRISEDNKITEIMSSKTEGEEFDNYPDYLDSSTLISHKGESKCFHGELNGAEKLFLVTDALSDYLFRKRKEDDFAIVDALLEIRNQDEFEELVDELRVQGMTNDDTTLVIIENDGIDAWSIPFDTDLNYLI
jgi:serine/threonine protein phosphatase PrpC